MNDNTDLLNYMEARRRFYEQLEAAKGRLDHLLNDMLERPATLSDLARLEGLHQEKRNLFSAFVATEDRFVGRLLAQRSVRPETESAS